MAELPNIPDVARFLAYLLIATEKGSLRWEPAGSWIPPNAPNAVVTVIGGGYSALIELVPDFEQENPGAPPDHSVTLIYEGTPVLAATRLNVDRRELSMAAGREIDFPYVFFDALWNAALATALNLREHLRSVNELLAAKAG